jgi:tripartite-type tricarboxylate transporter receptor subunit TctC
LLAPAKTPPEIIARMNAAMADALQEPMVKQGLTEQGIDYRLSSPEAFGRFLENEIKRWAKVVKDNKIVLSE